MNTGIKKIDLKNESLIIVALSDCLDILDLIAKFKFGKGTNYFTESLFIRLKHLAYYFTKESSPLIQYNCRLNADELIIIDKIENIRHASAHLHADQHWLSDHLMISGAKNFKNQDVEIQYGPYTLFLIKDVLSIYKKFREIFSQASELQRLSKHSNWGQQEKDLKTIEKKLVSLLKNPVELLKINNTNH